uniref:Uncharacterized protein n=1 Tax=Trichobilharzia regenti TaxID=157069 RepID=A0AA85K531_TRIRE|nr:unnamed protein product [Trichobilharzia regenti]
MDISRLRASPHFDWMNGTCLYDHSFSDEDIKKIRDLNTYWTNPTLDISASYWVYFNYGACTVMDKSGPSLILYFNRGINLYKQLMTPNNVKNLNNILKKKVHSTAKVEDKLLKKFGVQPKLICAQSEAGSVYLHELVFCFNEASSLINCPTEYASQLEEFNPDDYVEDEELLRGEIQSQILCPAKFVIPDYKILGDAKDPSHDNDNDDDDDDYYYDDEDEDGENGDGEDEDDHY